MNRDTAFTLRLAALREHAAAELAEASGKQGPDALEHAREARAALQRALELEREAA